MSQPFTIPHGTILPRDVWTKIHKGSFVIFPQANELVALTYLHGATPKDIAAEVRRFKARYPHYDVLVSELTVGEMFETLMNMQDAGIDLDKKMRGVRFPAFKSQ